MKVVVLITAILLIAVIIYGLYDCKRIDRNYDQDQKRFEKRRKWKS